MGAAPKAEAPTPEPAAVPVVAAPQRDMPTPGSQAGRRRSAQDARQVKPAHLAPHQDVAAAQSARPGQLQPQQQNAAPAAAPQVCDMSAAEGTLQQPLGSYAQVRLPQPWLMMLDVAATLSLYAQLPAPGRVHLQARH